MKGLGIPEVQILFLVNYSKPGLDDGPAQKNVGDQITKTAPLCNRTPESAAHLLIHCLYATRIWT
jgi:hypothetical protein